MALIRIRLERLHGLNFCAGVTPRAKHFQYSRRSASSVRASNVCAVTFCSKCAAHPSLMPLLPTNPNSMRIVVSHFPIWINIRSSLIWVATHDEGAGHVLARSCVG